MAKSEYSADSAPLPQSLASSNRNKLDIFNAAHLPAPFPTDRLSVNVSFLVAGTNGYIGESADVWRRLAEHGTVRRTAGQSGTCTPTHTSIG